MAWVSPKVWTHLRYHYALTSCRLLYRSHLQTFRKYVCSVCGINGVIDFKNTDHAWWWFVLRAWWSVPGQKERCQFLEVIDPRRQSYCIISRSPGNPPHVGAAWIWRVRYTKHWGYLPHGHISGVESTRCADMVQVNCRTSGKEGTGKGTLARIGGDLGLTMWSHANQHMPEYYLLLCSWAVGIG